MEQSEVVDDVKDSRPHDGDTDSHNTTACKRKREACDSDVYDSYDGKMIGDINHNTQKSRIPSDSSHNSQKSTETNSSHHTSTLQHLPMEQS